MLRLYNQKIKKYLIVIIVIAIVVFLLIQFGHRNVDINNSSLASQKSVQAVNEGEVSSISGLACANYDRRPIAVMLAMDPVTRPLSGVGQADLIIEMPVITDSITRLMAVFVCQDPEEIGSVRSTRHDYIPLAMGLDAILAHWGGSHYALDKLNAGIMDNIDALKNPYKAYWQKSNIPMPHNGFTSMSRLVNSATKLGYRLTSHFEGYPHLKDSEIKRPNTEIKSGQLTIGYPGHYRATYKYNAQTNSYRRWREGTPEIDALDNQQVAVKNIVIMRASSRMIEVPNYNDVDVEGTGVLTVYRNGEVIEGTWQKKGTDQATKLYFFDQRGKEIKFVPGQIWVEIMEPYQEVNWTTTVL